MGSPIDVGGQYPFITFFTPSRLSGKFLLDWKDNNLESTVEWVVDEQKCIQHMFVCAVHLKSAYKGTIFIYSGLTCK